MLSAVLRLQPGWSLGNTRESSPWRTHAKVVTFRGSQDFREPSIALEEQTLKKLGKGGWSTGVGKQCTQEPNYYPEFSQAAMQAEGQSGDSKDRVRALEGHPVT